MGLTGLLNKVIFRGKQRSCDKLRGHVIRWDRWDQYELFSSGIQALFTEKRSPPPPPPPQKKENSTKYILMKTSIVKKQNLKTPE